MSHVGVGQVCPECEQHLFHHVTACPVHPHTVCNCTDRLDLTGFERVVKGYRLQKSIGHGSYGRVWWAVRLTKSLFPEAVVKEYFGTGGRQDELAQREIAALRNLGSPWIPYFIADQPPEIPEKPWTIVMEYYDGKSLRDVMRVQSKDTQLPDDAARIEVLLQIALALAEAHEFQCWHRDLKPENILVQPVTVRVRPSKTLQLKVVDWGLTAHDFLEDGRSQTELYARVVIGSYAYWSPEHAARMQLDGSANLSEIDGASDVFSLGIIWWELFSSGTMWWANTIAEFGATKASPPNNGAAYQASIFAAATSTARATGSTSLFSAPNLEHIPAELQPLFLRCFAVSPPDRPAALEVASALHNWLRANITTIPGTTDTNTNDPSTATTLPGNVRLGAEQPPSH